MTQQTLLGLDEPFVPHPTRVAPLVYVRRLRLFGTPTEELRDLELAPGLNVIWAPDADADERVGTKIGHGAGKTLLCRLIRYVLGEPRPAAPDDAAALVARFPDGSVRAEVMIEGVLHEVERPFDHRRDASVTVDLEPVEYHVYLERLRASLGEVACTLDPLASAMAWSSRDQERRFGGPLSWRDRMVCPDSRLARVANLERVGVIRSLLGLRDALDIEAEREVAQRELEERTVVERLADRERQIAWAARSLSAAEASLEPLRLAASIRALEIEEAAAMDAPVASLEADATTVEHAAAAVALAVDTLARLEAVDGDDDCGVCRSGSPRPPTRRMMRKARSRVERANRELTRAREALSRSRRAVLTDHAERYAALRERLGGARELARSLERREQLGEQLRVVRGELAEARTRRDEVARRHAPRLGRVRRVYDFVVRRLAGQEVRGELQLGPRGLEAKVILADGRAGNSPAMRVLATLALDLAALVLSTEERTHLPGLLIHDSPREADLARSHYDALYRLADWLADATPTPGFQYIVTTTTRPPSTAALRAIRLGAAHEDELLLRAAL